MDFHIDVVCCRGRVDVNDRLIVRVVYEPADAVCRNRVRHTDYALHIGCAYDRREINSICASKEIGDRVGMAGTWLRIRDGLEDESIIAAATLYRNAASAANEGVVFRAAYQRIATRAANENE